uniref:LRRNT domain-containing protein n=1 Tax=Panagrellus redivivus TaxID=6233 RepID=A0A7E4WCW6_PANRE
MLSLSVVEAAKCPEKCTCIESDVTCVGANYSEVVNFIRHDHFDKLIIRDTALPYLEPLPLTSVFYLEFSNCQMTTIATDAFKRVISLKQINLDYNLLTVVQEFENLEMLQSFSAKANLISQVSSSFFNNLDTVTKVDFAYNLLDETDFLEPLNQTLVTLDLSHNLFQQIEISNFSQLVHLNLTHNVLRQENSVQLVNLSSLVTLNLAENGISTLNVLNLTSYDTLKTLDLENNHLFSPLDVSNFSSLTNLQLKNNRLTQLKNNRLTELPLIPPSLKKLDLSNNNIVNGSELEFVASNLTDIKFTGNGMTSLNKNAFANLNKINLIDLTENNLTSFDVRFSDAVMDPGFVALSNMHLQLDRSVIANGGRINDEYYSGKAFFAMFMCPHMNIAFSPSI